VTEEELRTKQQKKREAQAKAWLKWYRSPKGEAYRKRAKEKRVKET
jgi:hypothetical protein